MNYRIFTSFVMYLFIFGVDFGCFIILVVGIAKA